MRKNLQHIKIEKSDAQNFNFEHQIFDSIHGVKLKSTYSKEDIQDIEYLDFGAGFAPNLRGIETTMYIQQPWKTSSSYDSKCSSVEEMKEWLEKISDGEIGVLHTTKETLLSILKIYFSTVKLLNLELQQPEIIIHNDFDFSLDKADSYSNLLIFSSDVLDFIHSQKSINSISLLITPLLQGETTLAVDLANTLIHGLELIKICLTKGMKIDEIASHLYFSIGTSGNHFIEIAKMRAARIIWAKMIKKFNPIDSKTMDLKIHSQIKVDEFLSNDSDSNKTTTLLEASAALFGGTQSLEFKNNKVDQGLDSRIIARKNRATSLFLLQETKITHTVDPWGGSFYVETLTNEIFQNTWNIIVEIESLGGVNNAIASGYIKLKNE